MLIPVVLDAGIVIAPHRWLIRIWIGLGWTLMGASRYWRAGL
jgi:hypothetical protein